MLEDNTLGSADFFLGAAIARESHVHMLAHTGCRAIVVSEKNAHEIEAIRGELPDLDHVLVRDSA